MAGRSCVAAGLGDGVENDRCGRHRTHEHQRAPQTDRFGQEPERQRGHSEAGEAELHDRLHSTLELGVGVLQRDRVGERLIGGGGGTGKPGDDHGGHVEGGDTEEGDGHAEHDAGAGHHTFGTGRIGQSGHPDAGDQGADRRQRSEHADRSVAETEDVLDESGDEADVAECEHEHRKGGQHDVADGGDRSDVGHAGGDVGKWPSPDR